MESKSDLCNMNWMLFSMFQIFKTSIWDMWNSFFKLKLNIEFELSNFTDWIFMIKILFLECMILWWLQIEFDCVISSSNCFNIIINILIDLNWVNIVKVNYGKEIYENNNTRYQKTICLSDILSCLINCTYMLNIKECILSAFFKEFRIGFKLILSFFSI